MDQNQNTAQNSQAQSQPVSAAAVQPNQGELLQQLQQTAQQELANRPDSPTMFTRGNTGRQAVASVATPPAEDPLAKLLGLVKGEDGKIDNIKVKNLFVTVGKKISHSALEHIVEEYRKKELSDAEIVTMLLYLDKEVESGEISEELFQRLEQENGW